MGQTTLLLTARSRFAGQRLPADVAQALGRADRLPEREPGESAQWRRHFDLLPRGWPVAALTRQRDAGDAGLSAWLRADPAYVRPDINGVRLLALGEGLALDGEDVAALLPALKPLFGDAGFPIDAPLPQRWYLRLPKEARLPVFAEPGDALGADLFEHLPGIDESDVDERGVDGGGINESSRNAGRRWRALLSDAQVVLHNHPWNARRIAAGKLPVNSLWFWGGGMLPDHVASAHQRVYSDDALAQALAAAAQTEVALLPERFMTADTNALFDLRDLRDADALARDWLVPATAALQRGELDRLLLDCADGAGFVLVRGQRWRFWRKPLSAVDA